MRKLRAREINNWKQNHRDVECKSRHFDSRVHLFNHQVLLGQKTGAATTTQERATFYCHGSRSTEAGARMEFEMFIRKQHPGKLGKANRIGQKEIQICQCLGLLSEDLEQILPPQGSFTVLI